MDKLFLTILNMSLTGAFVIAVICLVRLPLKKAPKIISYCLWAAAGFRLVFPYSIRSVFSLMPFKAQAIPQDIAAQPIPRIDSGVAAFDNIISSSLPAPQPGASVNPLQISIAIGSFVWLAGAAVILLYGVISIIILKHKMQGSIYMAENIYEAKNIKSPFVLGILKPRIYMPVGLSGQERGYILLHEQTHIKRRDHIVKFAAYCVLSLHWFNPLVWAAFLLMGADMEMSCDEHVLKKMGAGIKKDYSLSLLSLAAEGQTIGGSPLAFGEHGIKERIKNVLKFKKASRLIVTLAAASAVMLCAGFAVNRPAPAALSSFTVSPQTYYLENPTDKQKLERLLSVSLYNDGTALLATPPISSYMLPKCTYSVEGNELQICAVINSKFDEEFYGVKNGRVIATFEIADANTLVFRSAAVPLFSDSGARYIGTPSSPHTGEAREWLNFYRDDQLPWGKSFDLKLPEYPDTVFRWTPYEVKAIHSAGETTLFSGMPIWNVYLADLTGDGLPEFCATVSFGSGIIDTRIIVYDYSTRKMYEISDRMYYDYAFSIEAGRLVVTQSEYNGAKLAAGSPEIIDGELVITGIDRTKPQE